MNFQELVKATEDTHCNDELIISLMRRTWLESKYDSKPLAQIKYVDYICSGWYENACKPFYTVSNTSATIICQTKAEIENWAIDNGMRLP